MILRDAAMRAYQEARLLRARVSRPPHWRGVRILGYHSISSATHSLCVSPSAFREQMEVVAASPLTPVRLDRALDLLPQGGDEQYVCVTFDDGYLDNLQAAAPVLRELGIPATIFVSTAIIDGTSTFSWFDDPPQALSWDDVRALDGEGLIDVQAHTRTHPWLPHVDDDTARQEIEGSKRDLEEQLGHEVTSFCYPAGLYGPRDVELVHAAGFRAGVTTDPGVNDASTASGRLRRTLVYGGDGTTVFAAKLDGRLDKPPALRAWLFRRRAAA